MKKFKNMWKIVSNIEKKTNKKKLNIIFDILYCYKKYKASFEDYEFFEMYTMTDFERKTVLTKGKNEEYIKKYNNPKFMKYLDSYEFNNYFKKCLKQDWLKLNRKNTKEFQVFCKNHKKLVIKGKNNKIETLLIKKQNLDIVYEKLMELNKKVIEERIENKNLQNEFKDAFLTVNVLTFIGKIVTANLEINDYNKDGLLAPINLETGYLSFPFVDHKNYVYQSISFHRKDFHEIKIPNWKKLMKLVEEACLEIPEISYMEWKIEIGNKECTLLSGNGEPNYKAYQLKFHRNNNVGLIPLLKQIEEKEIGK